LKSNRLPIVVFVFLCSSLIAISQIAPSGLSEYSFTISASQPWTDTGVGLSSGDKLTFTAEAKSGADANCTPQGTSSASSSSDKLPLSDAPAGALIARTAPFTWNGAVVWVGAGTHDIGFEKDIRTGKLTHKIDPAVDGERENIAQSFDKSGKAKSMTYYLPPDPVQDAKNASGGSYHSYGRLLVVFLK
jgi:hypothetical protein